VLCRIICTKEWCIGEIAVWKKIFYNLYRGMVYWWNSCLEKKTAYNLYQRMVYWWNNCLKKNILQSVPRNVYMYLVHWWKSVWIKHYANFLVIRCSRFSDFIICLSVLGKTISTKEWCIGEITVWEKKTFYHLYQGILRCAWCIGEITVWRKKHFTICTKECLDVLGVLVK
jgi:hypothetical protein